VMQTKLFMRLRLIIRMQEKIRDVIVITVSFENVAKLSHVFRNYNIKSNFISTNTLIKLISTNSAYQLVQNILSSYLLFKNLKIKIYRTVVLLALYNLFFTR
jgi:type II restriction/modification system DNA methylase subunit YeeA